MKIKEKMIELFASDYGPLMRSDDCLGQDVRRTQDRSELFITLHQRIVQSSFNKLK